MFTLAFFYPRQEEAVACSKSTFNRGVKAMELNTGSIGMDEEPTPLHFFSWNNTADTSEIFSTSPRDVHSTDDLVEIEKMMYFIAFPILIIFGTFGNVLVFVVMRRGSLKHVSTCFYMSILALADTGVLWCGFFFGWLEENPYMNISPWTWTDCKLTYFCWYFPRHLSSALLVIVSVEKFFALYFPLKTKTVCTVKIARRVTIVAAVILAAYESQFFFIIKKHKDNYCEYIRVSKSYAMTVSRIDAVLYSFAPFAIIGLLNLAIIFKFVEAKLQSARAGTTESTNQALSKSAIRGTAILIMISTTFIILTGPAAIIYSITNNPNPILAGIVYIFLCMNHSINAVLYCIVGSRFRQQVIRTLSCSKWKVPHKNREVERTTGNSTVLTSTG